MARYKDAVCRLCRREGMKLFLKGAKCFTDKCPIEKRNFAPGQHGKDRKAKIVGYGLQLREKQKAKRIYFTQEKQFRNYFERAAAHPRCHRRSAAATAGTASRQRRLPPRLCRSAASGPPVGSPRSRPGEWPEGRHSFLPGECRRRNLPCARRSNKLGMLEIAKDFASHQAPPAWLEVDRDGYKGRVVALPTRNDINLPINEQLIVELYSK